jgi:V-type H+-transporting ATPase subunit a
VPRYKEVNPCIFTIITFPFLFGVMYGDIGHGSLLALMAIALCVFERRLEARRTRGELGDMASMLFSGRYVLLFMALFSIYCGSVYNDVFSVSTNLFGSGFAAVPGLSQETLAVRPYPFGLEPDWQNRRNELLFYSSVVIPAALGARQQLLL